MHGLLQLRVALGTLGAAVLDFKPQIVQAIQLANGIHPGLLTVVIQPNKVRMSVGQLKVVAPLMALQAALTRRVNPS